MFNQQFLSPLDIIFFQRSDNGFVVAPHFNPIIIGGQPRQLASLVNVPVSFEHARHKGVIQAAEENEVKTAVFVLGNVDRLITELFPGTVDNVPKPIQILSGKASYGSGPERGFDSSTHLAELLKRSFTRFQGKERALSHRRSKVE